MTSQPPDGATSADRSQTPESADAGAKDRAEQAASEASNQAQHVGGVAQDQASQVAAEAKEHARGLLDDATTQVEDQARTQMGRLSQMLRTVGGDLDEMAGGEASHGVAKTAAQEVASRAHALGEYLDGREPRAVLDDVRSFARRRPGTFLLGALAAGVVAGRLGHGAQSANSSSSTMGASRPAAETGSPVANGEHVARDGAPSPLHASSDAAESGVTASPTLTSADADTTR